MPAFYSRICWNSNGWIFPSGEAQRLEKKSFVTKTGFGHEEWLLNFAWLIDGYHYSYLQPVGFSFERVTGQTTDILLYAINPERQRVYVGNINNCEVLNPGQARNAFAHYRKVGWLADMKQQLRAMGADVRTLNEPLQCFNIRFRPNDYESCDPLRIAASSDAIKKLNRYRLVLANAEQLAEELRQRGGSADPPSVRTITRSGVPALSYDPVEKELQAELLLHLKRVYGKDNVRRESNFVDLTVADGARKILIEIKSDSDARLAIRKALGQILEYAYFNSKTANEAVVLVIVAPGPETSQSKSYIKLLRERFGIPVSYARFSLGDALPGELDRQ